MIKWRIDVNQPKENEKKYNSNLLESEFHPLKNWRFGGSFLLL